jgi:hypothetical protein
MAQLEAPTPAVLYNFVTTLPREEQGRFDLFTAEGEAKAIEAYHAAMARKETLPAPTEEKERKAREAQLQTVLVMWRRAGESDWHVRHVGTALGRSAGRAAKELDKLSPADKLTRAAEYVALDLRRQGVKAEDIRVMVLPTEKYLGGYVG